MNQEQFVAAIRAHVMDGAVTNVMEALVDPPGRFPSKELVQRSEWFNALSSTDREMLAEIMREVSHAAVFGFLCVIDGVRTIDPNHGDLSLVYKNGDTVVPIGGADELPLHDVLNAPE